MKTIIRTAAISIIGLFASYRIIRQVDHNVIFDSEINTGLTIAAILVFIRITLTDWKSFRKTTRWTQLIPSAIGVATFIGLLATLYALSLRDKSPSKLYCVTKIVDFNGASIDFRENGTYKLTSWCLGYDNYRGTYTISDSIITLDKSAIEKIIESNRLMIKADGLRDSIGNLEKSIYQIDTKGEMIKSAIPFRVIK